MRCVLAFALCASDPGAAAGAPRRSEYEVKAAFLYNFAKFVKWPDDAPARPAFVVTVLGDDPFGPVLDRTFAGKTILDMPVEVRRATSLAVAREAHLLFVSASEGPRLDEVMAALEGSAVLTVGDAADFVDRGGMLAFRLRDDVVRFEVNLDRVGRARLRMSSQLIKLAQRVIPARSGGSG